MKSIKEIQSEILTAVRDYPGLNLKRIAEATGIPKGSYSSPNGVPHHALRDLLVRKEVFKVKEGGFFHYYLEEPVEEKKIEEETAEPIESDKKEKIFLFIASNPGCRKADLARFFNIHPSAFSPTMLRRNSRSGYTNDFFDLLNSGRIEQKGYSLFARKATNQPAAATPSDTMTTSQLQNGIVEIINKFLAGQKAGMSEQIKEEFSELKKENETLKNERDYFKREAKRLKAELDTLEAKTIIKY